MDPFAELLLSVTYSTIFILDKSTAPILPFVVRGPSSLNGPTYRADGSKLYFRGIHDTR